MLKAASLLALTDNRDDDFVGIETPSGGNRRGGAVLVIGRRRRRWRWRRWFLRLRYHGRHRRLAVGHGTDASGGGGDGSGGGTRGVGGG